MLALINSSYTWNCSLCRSKSRMIGLKSSASGVHSVTVMPTETTGLALPGRFALKPVHLHWQSYAFIRFK